jgi:hypothetical protein
MRNNQLEQALVAAGFQKQKEVRAKKPKPTQLHDVTEYKLDWDSLPQEARDAFSVMFTEN